ncbi:MAG: class I SAM-dependent methyltransferase [Candidatus Thorarchaeota archaeon]
MSNRGEKDFIGMPDAGAVMYDRMMKSKSTTLQINEIADFLASRSNVTRLLDVGTGHGRLLLAINERNPFLELYGLDISKAMIKLAEKNLEGIPVSLHLSPIQDSPFEDDFFDLVTCTGSFYLWNEPQKGLNEIYRILKPGSTTYLFETRSDYDEKALRDGLKVNLKGESIFKRLIMPRFLKKQLSMTYSHDEITEIISHSLFAENFEIVDISLANLPIWVRIELFKQPSLF